MSKPKGMRQCDHCGGALPIEKAQQARFCSESCQMKAANRRRKAASPFMPCSHCGKPFGADRPGRRFCCAECSALSQRRRKVVRCVQCGKAFHQHSSTARFCSASCVAKHKHATGVLRHFPRKLTARGFDRLLERQRPRRPYRMRLTAQRFDKIVADWLMGRR